MVAMGRALMARPRLLLLDEPSLGLAPLIADEVFDIIKQLSRAGVTILLDRSKTPPGPWPLPPPPICWPRQNRRPGQKRALLVDPELRRAFLGAARKTTPAPPG